MWFEQYVDLVFLMSVQFLLHVLFPLLVFRVPAQEKEKKNMKKRKETKKVDSDRVCERRRRERGP